jgi:hypothetical protein
LIKTKAVVELVASPEQHPVFLADPSASEKV